eukprot:scaffold10469_cov118-Isochrysis_galbana.AAC.12
MKRKIRCNRTPTTVPAPSQASPGSTHSANENARLLLSGADVFDGLLACSRPLSSFLVTNGALLSTSCSRSRRDAMARLPEQ